MESIKRYWLKLRATFTKDHVLHLITKVEMRMNVLFQKVHIESKSVNVLMLIPRVLFGYFILFDVGRQIIGLPISEIQMMDAETIEIIRSLSPRVVELLPWLERMEYWVQGAFLSAGFTTRLISLSLLWVVAENLMANPFLMPQNISTLLFFISTCLYSLVLGSGKYGIDRMILSTFFKSWRKIR
ncbi:hypothetical protein [Gracilimonas sediminicola]|uniref:Uncharacterized protein n=1 Tax=Gracilimonas sediminicola TaxID=2952158 RepID=A0A9X2L107_9BACT|nr:hypothetical protein [Gracilimonas sediminicola]MCP9290267.1 hypothetical protein [Gracilimonas sediminicola]